MDARLDDQASDAGNQPAEASAVWAKNKTALAKAVGRSRKTIERWQLEEGFPKPTASGKWNIPKVLAWMDLTGKVNEKETPAGKAKPNQTELKNRLLELQGKKIAHQLAVAKGLYVSVADAQKAIGDMIGEAKKVLLSGPSSLAPQVVGVTIPEAEKLLREWLHDSLARLSENPTGETKPKPEAAK